MQFQQFINIFPTDGKFTIIEKRQNTKAKQKKHHGNTQKA